MPDIHTLTLLLLAACAVGIVARRLNFPYAVALVIVGFVIGIVHALPHVRLEPEALLFILLPPLLFEAGINLKMGLLRRGALPIALLAILGTVISAGIVATVAYYVIGLPWQIAMMFGALISATDPVSVVAVFRRTPANPLLITVLEAEALFNDSVAVVLFGIASSASAGPAGLWIGAGQFVLLMGGGIALGVAVGYVASFITRPVDDHLIETLVTTVVAYGAYLLAEALHLSGVVATTCAAIVIGNYGFTTTMSERARTTVENFWEFGAFLVNSVVFLLVGIEATYGGLKAAAAKVLVAYLAVFVARAVISHGLGALIHRPRSPFPRSWRHLLTWAGLRGGLGMALALSVSPDLPGRDTLITITFGVVFLSLVIQGSTSNLAVRILGLEERRGDVSLD